MSTPRCVSFELLIGYHLTTCPATASDITTLDLYAHLSSMPKNSDVDHNAMDRDVSEGPRSGTSPQGKQLSKKELGRLRKKRELVEIGLAKGGEEEEEVRVKKAKADSADMSPEDGMDET
jgi:tRNA (guanine-N(7)-)-methyltransferase subunit TRM82